MKKDKKKKSTGEEAVKSGWIITYDDGRGETQEQYVEPNGNFVVPPSANEVVVSMFVPINAETPTYDPPVRARFLVYLLLPKKQRDALLGDLNEEYPDVCAQFGPRKAEIWYWKNVTVSLGPLLIQCLVRVIQWHNMAK